MSAAVALLNSENFQSHSKVQTLLHRLFGIEVSVASINRLRHEMSEAVLHSVQKAHWYVQQAPYLHSDETSFNQGNADAQNPEGKKGWLWMLVTELVVVFEVALSHAGAIAQTLMGTDYAGIMIVTVIAGMAG